MAVKLLVGVIGLGKFGFWFGQNLVELGHEVLGLDVNPDNVRRAQNIFSQVYEADAMDKEALKQIGFTDVTHALVSVGESISASTMISMYLKELEIPNVWVKAVHFDHKKLLNKIGVDKVIIPEQVAAQQLANRVAMPGFIDYLPFDHSMVLKELKVKEWAGRTLREIDLTNRFNIQIIAVKKAGDNRFRFIPKADDTVGEGDTMIVIGPSEGLSEVKS